MDSSRCVEGIIVPAGLMWCRCQRKRSEGVRHACYERRCGLGKEYLRAGRHRCALACRRALDCQPRSESRCDATAMLAATGSSVACNDWHHDGADSMSARDTAIPPQMPDMRRQASPNCHRSRSNLLLATRASIMHRDCAAAERLCGDKIESSRAGQPTLVQGRTVAGDPGMDEEHVLVDQIQPI